MESKEKLAEELNREETYSDAVAKKLPKRSVFSQAGIEQLPVLHQTCRFASAGWLLQEDDLQSGTVEPRTYVKSKARLPGTALQVWALANFSLKKGRTIGPGSSVRQRKQVGGQKQMRSRRGRQRTVRASNLSLCLR